MLGVHLSVCLSVQCILLYRIPASILCVAGMGKFISSATNMTYSGHWKDGLKDGQGSLYFPSGDIITGRWKEVRTLDTNSESYT
jgi:MORN repeat